MSTGQSQSACYFVNQQSQPPTGEVENAFQNMHVGPPPSIPETSAFRPNPLPYSKAEITPSAQNYLPNISHQKFQQYQQQLPLMAAPQPISSAPSAPHYPTGNNSSEPAANNAQLPVGPNSHISYPTFEQSAQQLGQPDALPQLKAPTAPLFWPSTQLPYQMGTPPLTHQTPVISSQTVFSTSHLQAVPTASTLQPSTSTRVSQQHPGVNANFTPQSSPYGQPAVNCAQLGPMPISTSFDQHLPAPRVYTGVNYSVHAEPLSPSLPQQGCATSYYQPNVNSTVQPNPPPPAISSTQFQPVPTSSPQQSYNHQTHGGPPREQQQQPPQRPAHRKLVPSQVTQDQNRQMLGTFSRQQSSDRTPGAILTAEEWNNLNCPISLLHDSNFLPSDGPDAPRKPVIVSEVNCHPDYMRCSLTAVPVSSKLQSKCRLPLGLLVQPFRDVNDLPVIQTSAIVRCRSCRTYINPFVKLIDNGRRWSCPVCTLNNTVPDEFYYDPATRSYGEPSRRPEIRSATVEFIAPSEYMLRPPQAATYVYCLEVSRNAVATGYLELVCNMLADQLTKMPGDARRQVALITYDSGVQFYILSGKSMRMVICQDLSEVFLPNFDGLINRINDNLEPLTNLLRQLPKEFSHTQDTSNCLGFVLQTALKLICGSGGRVTIFNSSLPNVGPGALEVRETRDDFTKPEAEHLRPSTDFYRTIALEFAASQIAVDLFVLNSKYCDIASISGVARFSGGSVYHYPNFHYKAPAPPAPATSSAEGRSQPTTTNPGSLGDAKLAAAAACDFVQVEGLRRDLLRYLTRKIGFEAVLRVRCSRGLAIQNFYGNFFVRSVDLLSLPNVNPDAGYGMQLEINENLDRFSTVVFQAALLYTSAYGDRRIRVHTLCLPVTDSADAVFNYADCGAVACLVAKMAVEKTITAGLPNAREAITTVLGDILDAYQRERDSNTSRNSLSGICPASLRLLPTYLCGGLRCAAFRNHLPTSLDIRSGALELIMSAPTHRILPLMYPRLYSVGGLLKAPACGADGTLAQKAAVLNLADTALGCLALTGKSINREGIFLLDTGNAVLLLVGYGHLPEELKSLIGYESIDDLIVEKSVTKLGPEDLDSQPRKRLHALIKSIRRQRSLGTALVVIRHDVPEPLKSRFVNALVEDRTSSAPSYSEYLQMVLSGRS